MTTTTHTQAALLVAAVTALNKQISVSKKGGVEVPSIGAEVVPGIKLRDLKNWLKDFTAKQADASKPAPVAKAAPAVKTPAAAKTAPVAVELKSSEIREAGVVLLGRAKETVKRITKVGEERFVITENGLRISVAHLERNNRGNIRVIESEVAAYLAEKAPAAKTPAAAAAKPAAKTAEQIAKAGTRKASTVEQEELPEEAPAATGGRVYPIRALTLKPGALLVSAEYDRNTSTLYATLKDGAVWAYEGVKLSEVRALENASIPSKHFSAHVANSKKGHMVKNHKPVPAAAEKAPVKTAAAKPAAKTTAAKPASAPAPQVAEISTTALRANGFLDGRKHETVASINRVKETGQRIVVTASGKRIPLDSIILVKGKFRVSDLALISGAVNPAKGKTAASAPAPAPKGTENTRKELNGKAAKLNFAAAEKAPVKTPAKVVSEKPSRTQVKEACVRVIKGNKEKLVSVIRIVNRDDVLVAVTENKGVLPYNLIMSFDGQPTYTGKITAEEFRAL
jgi:hypothetical protein